MARMFKNQKQAQLRESVEIELKKQLSDESAFRFAYVGDELSERVAYSDYSYWGSTFKAFFKKRLSRVLLGMLLLLVTFTFIQPLIPGQYDYNIIINNPLTGVQLANRPPSFTTAVKRLPVGSELTVQHIQIPDWLLVSNTLFSIQRRTRFSVLEYETTYSKIEYNGQQGYVDNANIKFPDNPHATPYEVLSNFKLSIYDDPANIGMGGTLYIAQRDVEITDNTSGAAITTRETVLRNLPTTQAFWFGTNNIGQDLWSRVWAGTRTSLFIGFIVALVEALVGILMGMLWGYVRKIDKLMTEIYNVIDNIPRTIVLILFSYVLRPSIQTLIFAMCLTGWLNMALFIRNQIVIIRDRDYNLASRCLGTPTWRIILKNLLPYLVSVIMLRMALAIPLAIGDEVFITYIGLGLPVSVPSLGNLINEGRLLISSPALRYQLLFPALVLSLITISFYIIGNAFSDAADPKNHM